MSHNTRMAHCLDFRQRAAFVSQIKVNEPQGEEIIYLDESGFSLNRPRHYGYSVQRICCYGIQNWHAKRRLNAIGVIVGMIVLILSLLITWTIEIYFDPAVSMFLWIELM